MSWFLDYKWINEWLLELFTELAPENDRLKIHPDDLKMDIAAKFHQGHYLNILAILGEEIDIPRIKNDFPIVLMKLIVQFQLIWYWMWETPARVEF